MFSGFQFPKTIFNWIEAHPGSAAWVQALGALAIIYVTARIASADHRERQRKERLQKEAMAVLLHAEMLAFRGTLERTIDGANIREAIIQAPTILYRLVENLYLLGAPGGSLLHMLGGLAANNVIVEGLRSHVASGTLAEAEAWVNGEPGLKLTLEDCDEGVAGLQAILRGKRIRTAPRS
jgi:hypothetical protein